MSDSTHLALPYIAAAQAQKHVTHNDALRILDALVMLAVKDRDLSSPPGSAAEGDRYLVKPTGSGGFAGKDNQIAHYRDGVWAFHEPQAGWICYVEDEGVLIAFDDGAWEPLLQNVALLGVGTEADVLNPFAAKLNNALWTARYDSEGGDGSLRYKLNKEVPGDTLSLLFQTGYSGRAEIGLAGDDDLHVKVSDDGMTWREGIVIAAATGKVSFPQGALGLREKLAADRTYYVRPDGDDANDGLSNTSAGAFLTIQKALDVAFGTLDLSSFNVTIQLADGTYTVGGNVIAPRLGVGTVTVQGNPANPQDVIVNASSIACFRAASGAALVVKDMELQSTGGTHCLLASVAGAIQFSNVRFGNCGLNHIRTEIGGLVEAAGNYSIVGNASSHINAGLCGVARVSGRTVTLTGTPAFTAFVLGTTAGMAVLNGNAFSGAATGKRYDLTLNSAVNVAGAGAAYLPGDASGTTATGGEYA